ncbi:MAG: phosphoribosylglycinamide formyltransferase [Deltaproteobacteria bacterium]|nr:phosphoribosylglycinamide formyltransferase [Deltaproteobacteria bacterium]
MTPIDLGVLISGRGSNLQAILDAIASGELAARVRVVIANRPKAAGLERAAAAGVPTQVIGHRKYPDRQSFDAALVETLRAADVQWVVLAGFMRILTPVFLDAFPNRVVNIHPALLPSFPGVDAHAQALAYGVRISGCTVHLVNEGVDTGPILAQVAVPVREEDDHDTLAARILAEEHRLLVATLQRIAQEGVAIEPSAEPNGRPAVRFGPSP